MEAKVQKVADGVYRSSMMAFACWRAHLCASSMRRRVAILGELGEGHRFLVRPESAGLDVACRKQKAARRRPRGKISDLSPCYVSASLRLVLRLYATQPMPTKPINMSAQVAGSGTAVVDTSKTTADANAEYSMAVLPVNTAVVPFQDTLVKSPSKRFPVL